MILSIREIIDMIIIIFVVGYIFSDFFDIFRKRAKQEYDPLLDARPGFNWDSFKFAAIVTAPAIIFHELGHKFVAELLGYSATFHAAYLWLFIGIALKMLGTGFIFFVPAFVSHSVAATPIEGAMIAFAGPAVNLLIWLGAMALLKFPHFAKQVGLTSKYMSLVALTGKINMFLFIFNMIPIGFFDGAHVLQGLLTLF